MDRRLLYEEHRGPFTRVRVDEGTVQVGRTRFPVDSITGLEPADGAVRVRLPDREYAIRTRQPHFLLAALREATAHDGPTEEQLAAARAIREAPEAPDPVLYAERQLRRARTIRVCERTLRISRHPPIRLEWIEEARLLDRAQVEEALAENERALGALAAADRTGELGPRQLDHWYQREQAAGTPDPNGLLWGPELMGAVYLEVEAGAAPVYRWLIGSRDPERFHRVLADAIARRKQAVRASGSPPA